MERVSEDLLSVMHSMYNANSFVKLMDFCQGEYRALHYLCSRDDKTQVFPSIISDALNISRARVTTTLSSLRKKGYIEMNFCEQDRRKIIVSITQKGRDYWIKRSTEAEKYIGYVVNCIGQERTNTFIDILRHILNVAEKEQLDEKTR